MSVEELRISIALFFFSFALLGFALTTYVILAILRKNRNDGGGGGNGDSGPYGYDPDDPADWWKKETVSK